MKKYLICLSTGFFVGLLFIFGPIVITGQPMLLGANFVPNNLLGLYLIGVINALILGFACTSFRA